VYLNIIAANITSGTKTSLWRIWSFLIPKTFVGVKFHTQNLGYSKKIYFNFW